jgi:hypothetical protein
VPTIDIETVGPSRQRLSAFGGALQRLGINAFTEHYLDNALGLAVIPDPDGKNLFTHHPTPALPIEGREHTVKPSLLMGRVWDGVNAAPLSI